jgi:hypothetical protein
VGCPHPDRGRQRQHQRVGLQRAEPGAGVEFDPATGNTATITFATTSQRRLRLTFTGNTGWPAGQLSELEVYGPDPGTGNPNPVGDNLAVG